MWPAAQPAGRSRRRSTTSDELAPFRFPAAVAGCSPVAARAQSEAATTWAQLLLKYVLANPAVTCAIPGARNPRYVADNPGAATGPLPEETMRHRIVETVTAA